jgi:nicotinate-nucleotide pyrophosphorylase (carboxylating)
MFPPYITRDKLEHFIIEAFKEDVGDGDFTSIATIDPDQKGEARLIFKENGIAAGLSLAYLIFDIIDKECEMEFYKKDGDKVKNGDIGFVVKGSEHTILKAERLVLNCMQRMSGIATQTAQYVEQIAHTKAKLLDTRKTTPNFRMFEKWAVLIGGGVNHRFGLFDMILIKDNHIDYAGGVKNALHRAFSYIDQNNLNLKVEIEARNLEEVKEILLFDKVHRILLDNMSNDMLKEAVQLVNGKIETEASGGVNLQTIKSIAETGVDYISVGGLTHSYKSLDISLKAKK